MLQLHEVRIPIEHEQSCRGAIAYHSGVVVNACAKLLGISPAHITYVRVTRRNIDARKKNRIHFSVSVIVLIDDEALEERLIADRVAGATQFVQKPLITPDDVSSAIRSAGERYLPPVIVGSGPAGLFCALYLARAGMRPVVIERGEAVPERMERIRELETRGVLNPESNIQFGEGGAGTYSDGKLTTQTKTRYAQTIHRWFVDAGAPSDILWDAHPHIGSDVLRDVVMRMREEILRLGGQVLFSTKLIDFEFETASSATSNQLGGAAHSDDVEHEISTTSHITAIRVEDTHTHETRRILTREVVLACGHSARDTFELLHERGVYLEQKPFSIGARIEHPQSLINAAQWGEHAPTKYLGAAEYKLAWHGKNGRSVYTFCMCPGGYVVCAASEEGQICTNGMSNFDRAGANANSALLVSISPEDFGSEHPLAGMYLQRDIEKRAYDLARRSGVAGRYLAPAMRLKDLYKQVGKRAPRTDAHIMKHFNGFKTTFKPGVFPADLSEIYPPYVLPHMAEALEFFDKKLAGFGCGEALLIAPEVRSSSPIRMVRGKDMQAFVGRSGSRDAFGQSGIYPCGEGAGYAGGIMSAAADGMRIAECLVQRYAASKH